MTTSGVIVGADRHLEWLLPWWWRNYQIHNRYPVTFFDFGLSPLVRSWCQKKGTVMDVPALLQSVKTKEEINPETLHKWEEIFSEQRIWRGRKPRFLKPIACAMSPYDLTLWIDVDCKVKKDIAPLFQSCPPPNELAIVPLQEKNIASRVKMGLLQPGQKGYNSGVIVFPKRSTLIREWAKRALVDNDQFVGDQDLLTDVILKKGCLFVELDPIYNWMPVKDGENASAVIDHFVSEGKSLIQEEAFRFLSDFVNPL